MFKKISEGDIFASVAPDKYASGSRIAVLPDGKLLCSLWYEQGDKKGIRYVKLEAEE